jgi:hypothetical protein
MVVVWPDQHIAHVLLLDGSEQLAAFFDGFHGATALNALHWSHERDAHLVVFFKCDAYFSLV